MMPSLFIPLHKQQNFVNISVLHQPLDEGQDVNQSCNASNQQLNYDKLFEARQQKKNRNSKINRQTITIVSEIIRIYNIEEIKRFQNLRFPTMQNIVKLLYIIRQRVSEWKLIFEDIEDKLLQIMTILDGEIKQHLNQVLKGLAFIQEGNLLKALSVFFIRESLEIKSTFSSRFYGLNG